jgi:hypothetical protein
VPGEREYLRVVLLEIGAASCDVEPLSKLLVERLEFLQE